VQACRNAEELRAKYAEASRWSSDSAVIVERCATGREFLVEGMAYRGHFTNLCIGDTLYFDLPDAFAAKSRIFPTTADDALRDRVLDLNRRIIEGFGLWQGITHSEFIMEGDEIYLIETAARGGGVFISADLIRLSCGLVPEEFLLDIATGREPDLTVLPQQCVCGYMAFFVPEGKILRVDGVQELLAYPWVHRNQLDRLHAGSENHEGHTDKTSRIALIISAPDRETFNERMKIVRQTLQVEVQTPEGIQGLIWE
jgi:carbamoyl-phosphate synthase large subunit